jgi:Plasmid pRiA4b ORF-3-like protein
VLRGSGVRLRCLPLRVGLSSALPATRFRLAFQKSPKGPKLRPPISTVTGIRTGEPGVSYPRYIDGERNGPPEDCGGIPGFYELLEALADPAHPDHAFLKQWAGDYDPDTFDALPIKYALGRIANRRNAAKARIAKKKQSSAA